MVRIGLILNENGNYRLVMKNSQNSIDDVVNGVNQLISKGVVYKCLIKLDNKTPGSPMYYKGGDILSLKKLESPLTGVIEEDSEFMQAFFIDKTAVIDRLYDITTEKEMMDEFDLKFPTTTNNNIGEFLEKLFEKYGITETDIEFLDFREQIYDNYPLFDFRIYVSQNTLYDEKSELVLVNNYFVVLDILYSKFDGNGDKIQEFLKEFAFKPEELKKQDDGSSFFDRYDLGGWMK